MGGGEDAGNGESVTPRSVRRGVLGADEVHCWRVIRLRRWFVLTLMLSCWPHLTLYEF